MAEQERMHREMTAVLERIDQLNVTNRALANGAKARKFFGRMRLKAKETQFVSGCCRRILQALARADLSGR